MPRVVNTPAKLKRRSKILKRAKGYWGARNNLLKTAREAVIRADEYATRDRRVRKREMRSLWIVRLNAACRENGVSYSRFVNQLKQAGIEMNRKALSELAISDPGAFSALVKTASEAAAQS